MDTREFLKIGLDDLEAYSGIEKTRWCKYFNGVLMNERNIYRFASSVGMNPGEFLEALNERRKKTAPYLELKVKSRSSIPFASLSA